MLENDAKALVIAAVRLAIIRHDLVANTRPGRALMIARDTWDAMTGVGTCAGGPVAELRPFLKDDLVAELVAAAKKVFAGLNARIDEASAAGQPVPVFDGIADLSDALNKAKGEVQLQ